MPVKYEPWGFKHEDEEKWGVRILEGKFANSIIAFNDISFMEDDVNNLQLDYTVVTTPESMIENYMSNDPDFKNDMKEIIEDVIRKAIDEHEDRDSNTAESNQ